MLAHREGQIVVDRQVREQAAHLEHHAHLQAHLVQLVVVEFVNHLAHEFHAAARWPQLAAEVAQQCGLAASADAEDRDDLAARDGHIDAFEHLPLSVGEMKIVNLDYVFRRLTQYLLLLLRLCTR